MKWRCMECGDVFETQPTHHLMDYCECGESYVDHETYHIRRSMNTEPVDE